MNPKKLISIIISLVILGLLAVGYFAFFKPEKKTSDEKGSAVETVKKASESVPVIATNPGEEVPEINPLDRANPFKYTNPLR